MHLNILYIKTLKCIWPKGIAEIFNFLLNAKSPFQVHHNCDFLLNSHIKKVSIKRRHDVCKKTLITLTKLWKYVYLLRTNRGRHDRWRLCRSTICMYLAHKPYSIQFIYWHNNTANTFYYIMQHVPLQCFYFNFYGKENSIVNTHHCLTKAAA